ncbi:MAG TPA: rRNA maturation RNase YbeY [Gammaproteobacteria bacterium]|nr:rRNA maturation RNase YbeY [Gammaproteobacteria bacterium]
MPARESRVEVQFGTRTPWVPAAADLRRWARAALGETGDPGELVVRVVDEAESAGLNEAYRHKHGPTNVLSFPFEAPPQVDSTLLGDVVICAPVVGREAREQGKASSAHWAHMVVHGVLHLRGYDHVQTEQAEAMEALERRILAQLGYRDPYATGD